MPVIDNGQYDFVKAYQQMREDVRLHWGSRYSDGLLTLIEQGGPGGTPCVFVPKLKFREGEVTVWGGQNGAGKSLITGQLAYALACTGQRCAIFSFEMPPKYTLLRICRQAFGGMPTIEEGEKFLEWTNNHLCILAHKGAIDIKKVLGATMVAAKEFGCKHVFIDNLMKVVAGEDDYNGQKLFVQRVCEAASALNIHIHIVHHVRKGEKETDAIDKFSFKGSSSIIDQVDNAVLLQRNRKKETLRQDGRLGYAEDEAEGDTYLRVAKQRNGTYEGCVPLWFDERSLAFCTSVERKPAIGVGGTA